MKLKDIPAHSGITAAQLAALIGKSPQSLNNYLTGDKGKPSKFVRHLCQVTGINREEIYFPDRFDHPDGGDPESPAYWLNLAIEAIEQAAARGADRRLFVGMIHRLHDIGKEHLAEITPADFEPGK
jgi:transcriptional regulator with XRE-family HTH domain